MQCPRRQSREGERCRGGGRGRIRFIEERAYAEKVSIRPEENESQVSRCLRRYL